jgi:hypothetical protein
MDWPQKCYFSKINFRTKVLTEQRLQETLIVKTKLHILVLGLMLKAESLKSRFPWFYIRLHDIWRKINWFNLCYLCCFASKMHQLDFYWHLYVKASPKIPHLPKMKLRNAKILAIHLAYNICEKNDGSFGSLLYLKCLFFRKKNWF